MAHFQVSVSMDTLVMESGLPGYATGDKKTRKEGFLVFNFGGQWDLSGDKFLRHSKGAQKLLDS